MTFSSVNTIWVLLGAALVFFMQAGFSLCEAGFTRAKNTGNILMKNLMDFCIGTPCFWLFGFGIMFGVGNSIIGWLDPGIMRDYSHALPSGVPLWAFAIFQTVFCATSATIVSGSMAERTKFSAYCMDVLYPDEKKRWYAKAPAFSFSKLRGLDAYLSPEMKSTGEAIGYDNSLTRALYKALQASGVKLQNYGTVFATISDADKEEALPLLRRFYRLGFNLEATAGTAAFLKKHGIRTRVKAKVDDGSTEILDTIRQGHVAYVINTMDVRCEDIHSGSSQIRRCAVENGVTMLTALDTVRVLLDVLEEITLGISTIDA